MVSALEDRGIYVPLKDIRVAKQPNSDKAFWDPEFQAILRGATDLDLATLLPAVQSDATHALFQLNFDGKEYAGRSRPMNPRDLVNGDAQRLLDEKIRRFSELAVDPKTDPNRANAIRAFRLPDPVHERDRFRIYERNGREYLLILWGYEIPERNVDALPPSELPVRLDKVTRLDTSRTPWIPGAALAFVILFALLMLWLYWGDQIGPRVTEFFKGKPNSVAQNIPPVKTPVPGHTTDTNTPAAKTPVPGQTTDTNTPAAKTPVPGQTTDTNTPAAKTPVPSQTTDTNTPAAKTPVPGQTTDTNTPAAKTPVPGQTTDTDTPAAKTPVPGQTTDTNTPAAKTPVPGQTTDTNTPAAKTPVPGQTTDTNTPAAKTPVPSQTTDTDTPAAKTPVPGQTTDTNTPAAKTPVPGQTTDTNTPAVKTPVPGQTTDTNTPAVKTPVPGQTTDTNTPAAKIPVPGQTTEDSPPAAKVAGQDETTANEPNPGINLAPQAATGPVKVSFRQASRPTVVQNGARVELAAESDAPSPQYRWTVDGVAQAETSSHLAISLPPGRHIIGVAAVDSAGHELGSAKGAVDLSLSADLKINPL